MNLVRIPRAAAALAALVLSAVGAPRGQLAAQTVQATLAGIPPILPSPFLGDVERDFRSGRFITVITVTGTAPVTVRFRFTLEHEGRRLVETVSDPATLPPGTYTYRTFSESPQVRFPAAASDLREQVVDALGTSVVSTGMLPEGRYTARLEPIVESGGVIGIAGTASFLVRYPQPAIPLTPMDATALPTRYPVFSWSFADVIPGATTQFQVVVVERLPTQTALQALEGNRPILEETVNNLTSLVYTPERLPLDSTKTYAWRIRTRVLLAGRDVPVREEGLSEPRTFTLRLPTVATAPPPPPSAPPPPAAPTEISTVAAACGVALPTNRTPASRTAASYVGTTIRLGLFNLVVQEATGSSGALNGRGHVSVPYLRAPLMVAFSGLAVNAEGVAYAGAAAGLPAGDAAGVLPAGVLGTFTGGAESYAAEALGPTYALARQAGHQASAFAGTTPVGLPIGIDRGLTGTGWMLAVLGARFTPTGAQVNAVLDAPMPTLGGGLALGARGVCLNPDGLGGEGETTLALVREVSLTVGGIGHRFVPAGSGGPGTFAVWKGAAFDRLTLALETSYPRSMLVPVDGGGAPREGQSRGRFTATVRGAGGWIATGTLDPSDIAALPGFGFTPTSVIYDNSLTANPDGMAFPEGYEGDRSAAWTGVYVPELSLRLPAAIRRFGGGRVEAGARGLLLDGTGLSFAASLANLISTGAPGDLGGWAYTLDRLDVRMVHSSLKRGELAGGVRIPLGNDAIPYTALLSRPSGADRLSFQFLLKPPGEVDAQVWMARLALSPSSHLSVRDTVTSAGTAFRAEAVLDGNLNLTTTIAGFPVDFRLVRFEQLGVTSDAPYVRPGVWEFGSPQHAMGGDAGALPGAAGGFPVEITGIRALTRTPGGGGVGIGLNIGVKLTVPGADRWLQATTALTPWGRVTLPGSGPMSAAFDELVLDSVAVEGNLSRVLAAKGVLSFYREDATFGNGIGGSLKATVLEKVEARAEARFGSRAGTDYWYVDAAFASSTGVPLMSGVGLYGLGGGASRNITRSLPTQAELMAGAGAAKTYQVDPAAPFELRASAVVGTHPSPQPFNADIALSATFTSSGGLAKVGLDGAGYFMTNGPTDRPANPTARGTVNLQYIVGPPSIFDGRFSFDVNRPPARGHGTAAMYFGPDKWFVRAGNPTDRSDIGLFLGLGGIGLNTHSYLYLGQDVPPLPPPPPLAPQPPVVTPSAASTGSGFAFGARTGFDFDETYLIFYAALHAGMGFDMALRDKTTCEGTTGLAGLNGWYATGQLYAYLSGAVGIDVDTWVYEGRLEAFKVAAGALLRGGAPNPVWGVGTLHGSYSVLGGLVEGSVAFEMALGDECIPAEGAGGALGDLALITDLQPGGGSAASVFEEPAAAFALQLDTPFQIVDNRGRVRTFRIRSGGIELRQGGPSGPLVAGETRREGDGGVLVLTPSAALAGHTTYFVRATAYAEELTGSGWQRARRNDGGEIPAQERTLAFRTGARPRTILPGDVKFTYPVDRQRFFLAEQAPEGRVEFRAGHINYDFLEEPEYSGGIVDIVVRFAPVAGGTAVETPATFEHGRVRFRLPSLQRETTYAMQIVRRERDRYAAVATGTGPLMPASAAADPARLTRITRNISSAATITTLTRTLPGRRVKAGERLLFHTHFRTSRFGTLQQKLSGASVPRPASHRTYLGYVYDVPVDMPEPFDVIDLYGSGAAPPLLEFQTVFPAGNPRWMREWVTPNVYSLRWRLSSTGMFGDALSAGNSSITWTAQSGTGVLLAPTSARPQPALSDADLMGTASVARSATPASSYLVSSRFGVSAGMLGGSGYSVAAAMPPLLSSTYVFRYRWNQAAAEDWRVTRDYAAAAVARHNASWWGRRPFDAYTYSQFAAAIWRPFAAPWSGGYPLQFNARLPWGGGAPNGGSHRITFPIP